MWHPASISVETIQLHIRIFSYFLDKQKTTSLFFQRVRALSTNKAIFIIFLDFWKYILPAGKYFNWRQTKFSIENFKVNKTLIHFFKWTKNRRHVLPSMPANLCFTSAISRRFSSYVCTKWQIRLPLLCILHALKGVSKGSVNILSP